MFFVMVIGEKDGETVLQTEGGDTVQQCLKKALKEHLITRVEKESYEHGVPCLCVIEADDYDQAIKKFENGMNSEYGKYLHLEIEK